MSDAVPSTNDRMAAIRVRFVARAIEQRARIVVLRDRLAAKAALPDDIAELRQLCHSLHGAAGTFGFGDISTAADDAETKCDEVISGAANPDAASAELEVAVGRLCGLLDGLG